MRRLNKPQMAIIFPMTGLVILIIALFSPQIFSTNVAFFSELSFNEKTTIILAYTLTTFAALEGWSIFMTMAIQHKRFLVDDSRNELEKAYGPLYTILNKSSSPDEEKKGFWLDFEERKRIDEIMATYCFMFPAQIYRLWQEKIRNLAAQIENADFGRADLEINLGVYVEFRKLINEEYDRRISSYHELLKKDTI
jgi:hypothetical protein